LDDLRHRLQVALTGRYEVERELGHGGMATDPLRGTAPFDRLLERMKLADLTPVA
jgi:hypothetical protein